MALDIARGQVLAYRAAAQQPAQADPAGRDVLGLRVLDPGATGRRRPDVTVTPFGSPSTQARTAVGDEAERVAAVRGGPDVRVTYDDRPGPQSTARPAERR